MSGCGQFTDSAFLHLRDIHTLYMWYCSQPAITDAAFVHLRGIHALVMCCCDQATITGISFAHLKGIDALGMFGCSAAQVATVRSLGLTVDSHAYKSYGALSCMF
jgi:hypothetical protein